MKRFPWRFLVYAVVLLYLVLDLKTCQGPLHRALLNRRDVTLEEAQKNRWVAIVNREPITSEQLDLAVYRHLYQRGKAPEEIPDKNYLMIRRATLQSLIDDTLVRQYSEGDQYRAPQEEIDQFIESWESQFSGEEEIEERSEYQDISAEERREELARIWSQKKWIEMRIEPGVDVTDEEVRAWFDANKEEGEGFVEPEKIHARHIFLSTVEIDDETREQLINEIHAKLTSGEAKFEELAKQYSEDERSKKWGGDLNWFARDRLAEDFTEKVFSMKSGEVSDPFRTTIGWHIVEVLDRQPERPVKFDEVKAEIRAHLENTRSQETIKVLLNKLRKVANIRLFPENI